MSEINTIDISNDINEYISDGIYYKRESVIKLDSRAEVYLNSGVPCNLLIVKRDGLQELFNREVIINSISINDNNNDFNIEFNITSPDFISTPEYVKEFLKNHKDLRLTFLGGAMFHVKINRDFNFVHFNSYKLINSGGIIKRKNLLKRPFNSTMFPLLVRCGVNKVYSVKDYPYFEISKGDSFKIDDQGFYKVVTEGAEPVRFQCKSEIFSLNKPE